MTVFSITGRRLPKGVEAEVLRPEQLDSDCRRQWQHLCSEREEFSRAFLTPAYACAVAGVEMTVKESDGLAGKGAHVPDQ
jgi:hypothetical protein